MGTCVASHCLTIWRLILPHTAKPNENHTLTAVTQSKRNYFDEVEFAAVAETFLELCEKRDLAAYRQFVDNQKALTLVKLNVKAFVTIAPLGLRN